ncbi:hypothetical protein [Roseateles chitinivorans]|uniref:hypothetical protein n=1 Tax=Roseateles chitinivorans TaxID=2917965 RepID=UPI003D67BBC0
MLSLGFDGSASRERTPLTVLVALRRLVQISAYKDLGEYRFIRADAMLDAFIEGLWTPPNEDLAPVTSALSRRLRDVRLTAIATEIKTAVREWSLRQADERTLREAALPELQSLAAQSTADLPADLRDRACAEIVDGLLSGDPVHFRDAYLTLGSGGGPAAFDATAASAGFRRLLKKAWKLLNPRAPGYEIATTRALARQFIDAVDCPPGGTLVKPLAEHLVDPAAYPKRSVAAAAGVSLELHDALLRLRDAGVIGRVVWETDVLPTFGQWTGVGSGFQTEDDVRPHVRPTWRFDAGRGFVQEAARNFAPAGDAVVARVDLPSSVTPGATQDANSVTPKSTSGTSGSRSSLGFSVPLDAGSDFSFDSDLLDNGLDLDEVDGSTIAKSADGRPLSRSTGRSPDPFDDGDLSWLSPSSDSRGTTPRARVRLSARPDQRSCRSRLGRIPRPVRRHRRGPRALTHRRHRWHRWHR